MERRLLFHSSGKNEFAARMGYPDWFEKEGAERSGTLRDGDARDALEVGEEFDLVEA